MKMTEVTGTTDESKIANNPGYHPEPDEDITFELQASFANNYPAPLLLVGFDGKIQVANPAARKILDHDLIGQQIIDVLPCADISIWQTQHADESIQFDQNLPSGVFQFTVVTQPSEQVYYLYGNINTKSSQEKILKRSLETTRTILEEVPIGILVVGKDKVIRDINKTALDIVGKKKEDVVGRECHDTMCVAEIGKCPILDIGNDINNSEREILNSEGNRIPILKTVIPVSIDGEDVLLEAFFDISKRREAEEERRKFEEALEESRKCLNAITEAAQDAIVTIDHESKVTFWNASAERIFGYSQQEVMGKDLHELILPENLKEAHAEGWRRIQQTGTGNAIGSSVELQTKHKNGSLISVELSLSSMRVGSEWHVLGLVRDISDRVAREAEYNQKVSQYMAMIDAGPAMMFLKDIDHQYLIANQTFCEFIDKPLDEIVGLTAEGLFSPHEVHVQHENEEIVMGENRIIVQQEVSFERCNEANRWFSTTLVPVHDQSGLVVGVVGLIQDITELHHSREQLVQADKMSAIGTLAAGVAHEINNPIGFIGSNLNTMRKYIKKVSEMTLDSDVLKSEDAENLKEMLEDFGDAIDESLDGTERVRKIVADMKSFSRVDKSQKELFNLNEGLESTLNIAWNELKYNCTVEKNYGDIPELYCMPNQLNQVFMNLLVNAGHAMQNEPGRVTITTTHDSENIIVTIADTGKGIERKNLKRIFEPFFTTKEVGKGTGLGLSMAYDIIQKHGGQLAVNSELGVGTEFTITLPLEGIEHG